LLGAGLGQKRKEEGELPTGYCRTDVGRGFRACGAEKEWRGGRKKMAEPPLASAWEGNWSAATRVLRAPS
jgi:hypothetical protein